MIEDRKDFYRYLLRHLFRGVIYLVVLVAILVLFKNFFRSQYENIEHWVSDDYIPMLLMFLTSEIFVGIIPPELFMLWSIDDGGVVYTLIVIGMAIVSLTAGWLNFWIGTKLSTKEFLLRIFKKRLSKYQQRYEQYGGGFIIVAALTPLPFSLISLLSGTLAYPRKKYLIFSSFRILRFLVYGIVVWNLEGVI